MATITESCVAGDFVGFVGDDAVAAVGASPRRCR
jgi:hypothetical protein